AAAELADPRARAGPEGDEVPGVAGSRLGAVDGGEERDVLVRREVGVEGGLLGHVADAGQHSEVGRPPPEHGHGPTIRDDQSDQGPDQRRLAGPVRAEQSVDLAAADAKRGAVERTQRSESLDDAIDLHGVGLCGHQPAVSGCIPRSQRLANWVTASSPLGASTTAWLSSGPMSTWSMTAPTRLCTATIGCIRRSRPAAICVARYWASLPQARSAVSRHACSKRGDIAV